MYGRRRTSEIKFRRRIWVILGRWTRREDGSVRWTWGRGFSRRRCCWKTPSGELSVGDWIGRVRIVQISKEAIQAM